MLLRNVICGKSHDIFDFFKYDIISVRAHSVYHSPFGDYHVEDISFVVKRISLTESAFL